MSEQEYREFYLITWCEPSYSEKRINGDDIHVIEYRAFQEAQDKIQQLEKENTELKAKLWIANNRPLRGYDGLVDERNRLEKQNKIMHDALEYYSKASILMMTIYPENKVFKDSIDYIENAGWMTEKHIKDNGDRARQALKDAEEL